MTTITGNGVTLSLTQEDSRAALRRLPAVLRAPAVRSLGKPARQRCKHQRHHKGCAVYRKRGFPPGCGAWNCRWLVEDVTDGLSRPDRSHYVLDVMPDYVTLRTTRRARRTTSRWCRSGSIPATPTPTATRR